MAKKTNPYLYTHEAKGKTRYDTGASTKANSFALGILTAQSSVDGVRSDQSVKKRSRKPLQNKQLPV